MAGSGFVGPDDRRSFTDFFRNAKDHARRLRKTGQPVVLTVDGQEEFVVQDARSYRLLLARLEGGPGDREAVRRGIADMKAGRGQPMDQVFDRIGSGTSRVSSRRPKAR